MKYKYLVIGSFSLFPFAPKSQNFAQKDTVKVKTTEIQLVYSHYLQDGNNSAVTGGIGTEELSVYGPALNIIRSTPAASLAFNMGTDIITSASTDNIDTIMSSASRVDYRVFSNLNYTRNIGSNYSVNGGLGFSFESDYFSIGSKLGFSTKNIDDSRSLSVQFEMYNDDLRWGRKLGNIFGPLNLIYPSELRTKEWYSVHNRNSYNLKIGVKQVLNERNVLGIFSEIIFQSGLLATPYHRIYFSDNTEAVEFLPNERLKLGLGLKLNSFVFGNVILKNLVSGYRDSFGVIALAIENQTSIKIKPTLILQPHLRFYTQKGSSYFKPYMQHDSNERFYTSDYDLSTLNTISGGLGIKYNPILLKNKKFFFDAFSIKYTFLRRSNNLTAHIVSTIIYIKSIKAK